VSSENTRVFGKRGGFVLRRKQKGSLGARGHCTYTEKLTKRIRRRSYRSRVISRRFRDAGGTFRVIYRTVTRVPTYFPPYCTAAAAVDEAVDLTQFPITVFTPTHGFRRTRLRLIGPVITRNARGDGRLTRTTKHEKTPGGNEKKRL